MFSLTKEESNQRGKHVGEIFHKGLEICRKKPRNSTLEIAAFLDAGLEFRSWQEIISSPGNIEESH